MIVKLIGSVLESLDLKIVRNSNFRSAAGLLQRYKKEIAIMEMTQNFKMREALFNLLDKSNSQTGQDLMALLISNFKIDGYFVEIGATDGLAISNTLLLAGEYSWKGILCEPGSYWQNDLIRNRPESIIETKCCWSKSGELLEFLESDEKELSTLQKLSSNDKYSKIRKRGHKYIVETITLEDLLIKNAAPGYIDFLSVDTEGSEFYIFENFPFNRYKFGFVVVEHNFGLHKSAILDIFVRAGYVPICENVSAQDFWFIPVR